MAVTRDDVIQTAIQLLQEVGLDGLTLRRLATELGISAPTLYWHVRDKRELLDLMAEAMVRDARASEPPFPTGLEWWEKIAEGMRRQYRALLAYRDGARVVAGNRPTEASLPMIEHFLGIWVEAGFSPGEALATILTFGDFVAGSALEYQSEMERRREQPPERLREAWKHMEPYPTLHAAAVGKSKLVDRSSFEHGLGLMIAGLRVRHAELMAEKQEAAQQARPPVTSSVN
ncbi:MAG: TetR/AcrR family transcriptional regulator C-terminal domain-containing protein [Devosia nanyangense]|uniref:TetR/AcrR family transcriptional regulator C-terminal domain-containing protein n=1 Tax=Devosia nanyangense TaxID=1228055 RepID=A0A933NY66_9HYPH|nr:TetR/AcrR family transcriptional regulator C-terminal domain-containing protein [Devosia nanyangense]